MNRTTSTFTCQVCGKQHSITCNGILQPFASPLAAILSLTHLSAKHWKELPWDVRLTLGGKILLKVVYLIVLTVLTVVRMALCIFYPVYLLLRLLYGD